MDSESKNDSNVNNSKVYAHRGESVCFQSIT